MTDPLPEGRFLYRRLFSYTICIVVLGLLVYIVNQLDGDATLAGIAKWLIGLLALVITYYMLAPSAEHMVRAIQAARKGGD